MLRFPAHRPLDIPFVLASLERLAFVPKFLPAAQGERHFGDAPVIEIQPQRHERQAFLLDFRPELSDLV